MVVLFLHTYPLRRESGLKYGRRYYTCTYMGWNGDVYVYNLNFAIPSTVRRIFFPCSSTAAQEVVMEFYGETHQGWSNWSRIRGKWKANLGCWHVKWQKDQRAVVDQGVTQGYRLAHLAGSLCVAIILAKWVAVEGYFLMRAECAKRESGWKGWLGISVSVYVGGGYLLLASARLIRRPCSWPHIRYKGASTYVHLNPSAHPPLLLGFCAWTRLELTF